MMDRTEKEQLFVAAQFGDIGALKEILADKDVDIDAKNSFRWTALMVATKEGHTDCVEELISAGADTDYRENGVTALMVGVANKSVECVKVLLATNVDMNHKNMLGDTALSQAAATGVKDCLDLLIAKGAKLTKAGAKRQQTSLMEAARNGHNGCVQSLIAAGENAAHCDDIGATALMLAIGGEHGDCVKTLLDAGVDINAINDRGCSALFYAVKADYIEGIHMLIDAGVQVDLEYKDAIGKNLLGWISMHFDEQAWQLLEDVAASQKAERQKQKEQDALLEKQQKRDKQVNTRRLLRQHARKYRR